VIDAGEDFGDGGGVGQHAACTLNLGEVATRNGGRGLVVNAALEASRAPVHELDATIGLDLGDGGTDVLGDNISSVHHANSHVLAMARIAFSHHGVGLENGAGELSHRHLLVDGTLGGDNRSIGAEKEVDARIGHKIDLEFVDIHVEGAFEAERGGEGADDLGNESVQIGVGGLLEAKVVPADVVDGFVVQHEGNIGVLKKGVGGKNGVVRFDYAGGDLRRGEHAKVQLALLAVIDGQTLQKESPKTGTGTTANRVEDEEALKTVAVLSQLANLVENPVHVFLADCVVAAGVVVGSILLAGDQLIGVEELGIFADFDIIDDGGFQIEIDAAGDVFAGSRLTEEGIEGNWPVRALPVFGEGSVGIDSVFEAIEFPA